MPRATTQWPHGKLRGTNLCPTLMSAPLQASRAARAGSCQPETGNGCSLLIFLIFTDQRIAKLEGAPESTVWSSFWQMRSLSPCPRLRSHTANLLTPVCSLLPHMPWPVPLGGSVLIGPPCPGPPHNPRLWPRLPHALPLRASSPGLWLALKLLLCPCVTEKAAPRLQT